MSSLFSEEELLETGTGCVSCGLARRSECPRMGATGGGRCKILVIGEYPTKDEHSLGKQFKSEAGQALRSTFKRLGYDLDDCRMFNAVNCSTPEDREPTIKEIECCRNSVLSEIRNSKIVKPNVVLLLGLNAIRSVIGYRWKKDLGTLSRWRGLTLSSVFYNAWVVSTFSPQFVLENENDCGLRMIWEQDIAAALGLLNTPIPVGTGVMPCTRTLYGEQRKTFLQKLLDNPPEYLAWDIETTSIKPYHKKSKIVTISFSYDGTIGIAMDYDESIKNLLCQVLNDKRTKKLAQNMKFENSWAKVVLGVSVRNWCWDSMLAAHVSDNRSQYCGLKFQTFINFDIPSYDEDIEPYLQGDENGINKIYDAPRQKLLEYNALDSVFAWRLAMLQRKMLY